MLTLSTSTKIIDQIKKERERAENSFNKYLATNNLFVAVANIYNVIFLTNYINIYIFSNNTAKKSEMREEQ